MKEYQDTPREARPRAARRGAKLDDYGDWLTLRDVAELTGLSMSHLYEAARSGWMAPLARRIGSRIIRVSKEDLRYVIEGDHETKSAAPSEGSANDRSSQ